MYVAEREWKEYQNQKLSEYEGKMALLTRQVERLQQDHAKESATAAQAQGVIVRLRAVRDQLNDVGLTRRPSFYL